MRPLGIARRLIAKPWVAGALAAAIVRLPNLGDGLDNDVAIYLTQGFAWAEGELPYRDLFDHKGPLNPELFWTLDTLLPASPLALRLVMFAVVCASLAQFAALLGRHEPSAAWPATVIYAVAVSSPLVHGHDFNTEQWALPLIIAAADLADRARIAVSVPNRERVALALAGGAGAAIAAVGALKSIYVVAAAPVVLVLLWRRPALLVAGAGGAAGALALILLPYAVNGTLTDLGDAVFDYSGDFARANLDDVLDGGLGSVARYLTETPDLALGSLAVVLGAIAFADRERRGPVACAVLAALAGWLVARLPGETYMHYFLLPLPGLAALCGLGVASLARRAPGLRPAIVALTCVPVAVVLGLGPMRDALAIEPSSRWGVDALPCIGAQDQAAEAVRDFTDPGDRIYVATGAGSAYFGQQIYWQARRLPASRFIFPSDLVPPAYDGVAADLAVMAPAAVVLMPEPVLEPVAATIEATGLEPAARIECAGGAAIEILAAPGS
jgi:hypothetical protein